MALPAQDPAISQEPMLLYMGKLARDAAMELAAASSEQKNAALEAMASALEANAGKILDTNAKDIAEAEKKGRDAAFIDRLRLTQDRVEAMAKGVREIAALPDPVGQTIASWDRPNGLKIARVRVPLGVIGMIYESRPNVTADAAALCLKSGNAVILRSGSDSFLTALVIANVLTEAIKSAGLPGEIIQIIPSVDRQVVGLLLGGLGGAIDVIVPRGGKSLVERVQEEARVPVFAHLEGNCHIYVDETAPLDMARDVVVNAKMRRPGICGAAETLLVARAAIETHLTPIVDALIEAGCEVRGDPDTQHTDSRIKTATDEDWDTEYLAPVIAVKVVDDLDDAIAHIAEHSSHHTDAIVTADEAAAAKFLNRVDSAIVMHNASTQFADGGEFGMGAEIGIATGRFHARGPVGVEQLTTFKYVVHGQGQTRP